MVLHQRVRMFARSRRIEEKWVKYLQVLAIRGGFLIYGGATGWALAWAGWIV